MVNARPRPRSHALSRDAIKALAADEVDSDVVEYTGRMLSASPEGAAALPGFPRGVRVFYLSFVVEAEVLSGGFNQFFWNSSSDHAEWIAPVLSDLGAQRAAEIFEQACGVAGSVFANLPGHASE